MVEEMSFSTLRIGNLRLRDFLGVDHNIKAKSKKCCFNTLDSSKNHIATGPIPELASKSSVWENIIKDKSEPQNIQYAIFYALKDGGKHNQR